MAKTPYRIPKKGSLGLLANGHIGLERWREVRGDDWMEALRSAAGDETPGDDALSPELEIVVVTGLPRSGTSMAMQMLVAGGLPAFTDGARTPDESNPRGYYEHDRVRSLPTDATWVPDADGTAVKVVAPLAVHLPAGPRYRVILMERDVDEILASQSAMLGRSDSAAADAAVLRPAYARFMNETIAWCERTPGAEILRMPYAHAVRHPEETATTLAAFAAPSGRLDAAAMAAAIDPSLHRQRSA